MAGDMACEVGGVDGLGSGPSRLSWAPLFSHLVQRGSDRPASARLGSAWLGPLI